MLRSIMILAVLALCAFMAGWFTIDRDARETTIRFNRDEIRADASKAIARGREILHRDEQSNAEMGPYAPQDNPYQTVPSQDQLYSNPSYAPNGDVPPGYVPQQATRAIPPWEQPPQSYPSNAPTQY